MTAVEGRRRSDDWLGLAVAGMDGDPPLTDSRDFLKLCMLIITAYGLIVFGLEYHFNIIRLDHVSRSALLFLCC